MDMDLFPKSKHVKEDCCSLTFTKENDAVSLFLKCLKHAGIQYGSDNCSHYAEHLKMIVNSATLQECRYDFWQNGEGSTFILYEVNQ